MKIVAKLFGFTCTGVFIFAAVMSLIGADNLDMIQSKFSSGSSESNLREKVSTNNDTLQSNIENKTELLTPKSYKISDMSSKILPYEFVDVNQIKDLLAKNVAVTVFLDNQFAKNPFLPPEQIFMVKLIGYNDTHFFSDGAEVSANEFVYLISDFVQVLEQSNSKIWY